MGDSPTQLDSQYSTDDEVSHEEIPTQPDTEVSTLNESDEPRKKVEITSRIREKVGIGDRLKRATQKGILVAAAAFAILSASACGKMDSSDPFNSSSQVMASENLPSEKDLTESPEMEEIWNRAIEFWPDTKLKWVKEDFFREAKKYSEIYPNYTPELLLPTFIAVSMTESNGGNNLGPNPYSDARGWFQVVPYWHLGEFNAAHGTSYTEDDLINNNGRSIEVGTWALMRYSGQKDLAESLKFFKGGNIFGSNSDDGLWWNRVSYAANNLMGGRDMLGMGFMDYDAHDGNGIRSSNHFLSNQAHIGNVYVQSSRLNGLSFDN